MPRTVRATHSGSFFCSSGMVRECFKACCTVLWQIHAYARIQADPQWRGRRSLKAQSGNGGDRSSALSTFPLSPAEPEGRCFAGPPCGRPPAEIAAWAPARGSFCCFWSPCWPQRQVALRAVKAEAPVGLSEAPGRAEPGGGGFWAPARLPSNPSSGPRLPQAWHWQSVLLGANFRDPRPALPALPAPCRPPAFVLGRVAACR